MNIAIEHLSSIITNVCARVFGEHYCNIQLFIIRDVCVSEPLRDFVVYVVARVAKKGVR